MEAVVEEHGDFPDTKDRAAPELRYGVGTC